MSAFNTALRWVKRDISPLLLQQAFSARRYDPIHSERRFARHTPVNVEHLIEDKIIRALVMPDLDLVSGTEISLPLRDAHIERVDDYNIIYRWDDRDTGGRTITQALEITYGFLHSAMVGAYGGVGSYSSQSSQILKTARDVLDTAPMPSGTAYIDIIAHNTVLLNDVAPIISHGTLRCIVSNEPNLSNWSPAYWPDFAKLVVAATKGYIYTQLNTEIDMAELFGGVALGKITQEIESYADANGIYEDLLKEFYSMAILNDRKRKKSMVKIMLGQRPLY